MSGGAGKSKGILWGEYLSFQLPSPPPSMNSAYNVMFHKRRVELKPEVRRYKTLMKVYVPGFEVGELEVVDMSVSITQNWLFKNGAVKKQDASNMLKVLIDLIAEKQGWDDARLWTLSVTKVHDGACECVTVDMRKGVLNELEKT